MTAGAPSVEPEDTRLLREVPERCYDSNARCVIMGPAEDAEVLMHHFYKHNYMYFGFDINRGPNPEGPAGREWRCQEIKYVRKRFGSFETAKLTKTCRGTEYERF